MRVGAGVLVAKAVPIVHARALAIGVITGMFFGAGAGTSVAAGASLSCANTAFRVGASAQLPDCRVYEQVSPPEKDGFAAYPGIGTAVDLSASDEAIAYLNFQAFPGAEGNTALFAGHVSTREASGWQTAEWTPKIPKAEVLNTYKVEYNFSSDLSQAVLQVPLVPLTPTATPNAVNLFRRNSAGEYSLINTAPPKVSVEEACGAGLLSVCWAGVDLSVFAGASQDFRHVIFESNAQFTESAPETSVESLYESFAGSVRLVGILPDGSPAATSTAGAGINLYQGLFDENVERAVSQDGSRIFWTDPSTGDLYVRENNAQPDAETVLVAEGGQFWTASSDGSVVYYTKEGALYEYKLATEHEAAATTALAPGGEVQGVAGAAKDGSYVYFVADGELQPGRGTAGQPNLYIVHDGGTPIFIATLSNEGGCRFADDPCDWSPVDAARSAYVTPDGRHIAFMSTRSLPAGNFPGGYDNRDLTSGESDSEVYEYSASETPEGTGELTCVSCALSAARSVGNATLGGTTLNGGGQGGNPTYSGIGTPFHRVRAMSDDGARVFYAAPASAGGYARVYEYEGNGRGSCTSLGGCQSMLSAALAGGVDVFLGSSADGSDVYLATSSRLAVRDLDNLSDIYDARIDGGFALPEASRCGSGCRVPVPVPTTGGPLSDYTVGPTGNLSPRAVKQPTPSAAQLLTKALKRCHAHRSRSRRRSCEALARRRYPSRHRTVQRESKQSNGVGRRAR